MTPQELKNSILQLAIQGKLVEQRADEGTGAELLEKIFAAKNAEGAKKNLPRRRSDVEATKESRLTSNVSRPVEDAPFDIPESWEWVRLESIINSVPTKQYQILESEVCSSGRFAVISQSKEYSIGFTDKSDKVYRHANPVIVFGDHTAEVKYIEFDFVVGADGVKVFEPKDSLITAKLLFYILQHYSCDLSKVGGYSRHYKFLKNKLIPLPPLAEQKRIVAKIEELLPLIDRYEKAWSRLEDFNKRFPVDMQKSLLQLAIQGKLVEQREEDGTGRELLEKILAAKNAEGAKKAGVKSHAKSAKSAKIGSCVSREEIPDDEKPFDIPESWEWVRIWEVFNLQAGKNIKSEEIHQEYSSEHKYKCYGGNGCRGYVADYNRTGHHVLIGRQGALCGNINYAEGDFYATEHAVVVEQFAGTDVYWCGYFLDALNLNRYATATAQPGLAVAKINQVPIPLPPLAEQKRIVAKLEELLPLCDRLK